MRPTDLISRPIAFNREFVEIAGSITAALFLSQGVYWSKVTDWQEFFKTQLEWEAETGMTRAEQEGAREKLKALGILKERYDRWKHRMYYQIDREKLDALLEANIRECGKPAFGTAENPHSVYRETTEETTAREVEKLKAEAPKELHDATFLAAWVKWEKHLRDSGKPIGNVQRDANWRTCIETGAEMSARIVNACIHAGYKRIIWDVKLNGERVSDTRKPNPNKLTEMQKALIAAGMPEDKARQS